MTASSGPTRGRWVLVLLVLSGAVGLSALPVWVRATASTPVTADVAIAVRGSAAAPGLVAAALVLLAAAGAVGLVGRVGRWVVVVVVAGAGALVVSSALSVRSGATAVAEQAAADATGVSRLVGAPQVAVWPWVAALLGVVVLVAAVGLARASGRWAPPSRRHERAPDPATGASAEPAGDPVGETGSAASDAGGTGRSLPSTGGEARGTGGESYATESAGTGASRRVGGDDAVAGAGAPDGRTHPGGGANGPEDERATWDALTRGDDPT